MLLHEINKYISFIEQSDVDYSKPRYDKMPILSVERQLYDLFNLEPAILYNEVPSIVLLKTVCCLMSFDSCLWMVSIISISVVLDLDENILGSITC